MRFLYNALSWLHLSSFGYLNAAQFLGAMNDNIFKLLIVFCFIHYEGSKSSSGILAAVGALYVVPFLLFSQTAGMMADRFCKRRIIVLTKLLEICVMFVGLLAFFFVSKFWAYVGLFLLASHSAIFAPCKYGIVPEIVPPERISKANGFLTSCTYIAIIIGTFLASFLTDVTNRNFVLAVAICLFFSVLGFLLSLQIQSTPPAAAHRKVTPWILTELLRSIRIIRRQPSLLTAVIGSAYFLFVGAFTQLNMIPFAMVNLHLTDIQGGYLFLLTALGIGAGSLLAGKFSGRAVELGLVPLGGIGMVICLFLLDFLSYHLYGVIPLVILVGLCGGLYLVPLDSFIQISSPKKYRGQIVATVNFLGFIGVLLAAGVLYLLSDILQLPPNLGFALMGFLTLFMVSLITISVLGYAVRFFSFIISRLLFRIELRGQEEIPLNRPSIFFIPYSFWPWAVLLLASQRRRMRLFNITNHEPLSWSKKISRRLLNVVDVESADFLLPNGEQGELILSALEQGTSIGIFCTQEQYDSTITVWMQAWSQALKEKHLLFFSVSPSTSLTRLPLKASKRKLLSATAIQIPLQ